MNRRIILLSFLVVALFLIGFAPSIPFPAPIKQALSIPRSFAVGPNTAATNAGSLGTEFTNGNLACYSNGYYYVFYEDSGSHQGYVSSATGGSGTWSAETVVANSMSTSGNFAVNCDSGSDIFIAYTNTTFLAGHFFYRQGTTSGGVITWTNSPALELACTHTGGAFCTPNSISCSSTTNCYIALWSTDGSANNYVEIWTCQTSSCTASGHWSDTHSETTNPCSRGCTVNVLSAADTDVVVESGSDKLVGIYTTNSGGSWTDSTASTNGYGLIDNGDCVSISTTLYCAFQKSNDLITFVDSFTTSWTETTLDTYSATGTYQSIATDGNTNLMVIYGNSSGFIYYQYSKNSGSTWSGRTIYVTGESSPAYIGMTPTLQAGLAGVIWTSSANVRFDYSPTVFSTTTFFTITCSISNGGASATNVLSSSGGGTQTLSSTSNSCAGSAVHYSDQWSGNSSDITLTLTVPANGTNTADAFDVSSACSTTTTTAQLANTTYTITEYEQVSETTSYSITGSSSGATAPTLGYTGCSNSKTYTLGSSHTIWMDYSTSWTSTNPLTGSGSTERWDANGGTSGTSSAGGTIAPVYYQQWQPSADYAVSQGGTISSPPSLSFTEFGSAGTPLTLTTSPQNQWIDASTSASATTPITISSTEQFLANTSSYSITSASGITFTYSHQFKLTTSAGSGGSVVPASTFYNSGNGISITATATGGHSFQGWTGTGSGSFTGVTNPATVTMNAALTESASFAATLTITNPTGLSVGSTLGNAKQNTSATSFSVDTGTKIYVYGALSQRASFTVTKNSYIYQEPSQGFIQFSNTTLGSQTFDGVAYVLSWSCTSACSTQTFIPTGFTITASSPTATAAGSYETQSGGSSFSITFSNPTSQGCGNCGGSSPPNGGTSPPNSGSSGPGGSGGANTTSTTLVGTTITSGNQTITTQVASTQTITVLPNPHPIHIISQKTLASGVNGSIISYANSTNWAGYVITSNGVTPITNIEGSFKIPITTCGTGISDVAYWVGIDGYRDFTVEQTGVIAECANGHVTYFPWYEFYPAPVTMISTFTVSPGDIMFGEVSLSGGTFTVTLRDNTKNVGFVTTAPLGNDLANSGEWITEAPSSGGSVLPLAAFNESFFGLDYTTIQNTNFITINGTIHPLGKFPITIVQMSQGGKAVATPTPLTADLNSFVVYGPATAQAGILSASLGSSTVGLGLVVIVVILATSIFVFRRKSSTKPKKRSGVSLY